jgi:hypothetical protein
MCPSTKYTTFVLGEFEVFRENLENAAKVPANIGGQKEPRGFFEWGFDQGELWLTKRSH